MPGARAGLVVSALVAAGLWLALAGSASGAPGQIGYDGCLGNDGARGCVDLPPAGLGGPLDGANAVAASGDGRSVYVASTMSASVSHFFRGQLDGRIAFEGCWADNPVLAGCQDCRLSAQVGRSRAPGAWR